jgi:hypothetical protein
VTTRYERIKMQRRMQRRIRMVVEERRMALALPPRTQRDTSVDPDETIEIIRRAVGRVALTEI